MLGTRLWRALIRRLQSAPKKRRRSRLRCEQLEERVVPATDYWVGTSSGNWDIGSNWSTGSVPGSGDTVVIDTTSTANITIQAGDSESVSQLTLGGNDTLSITGGSLSISASSTLTGALAMTGGSLTATGSGVDVTVNGATTISAASLFAQNSATLNLSTLTSYTGAPMGGDTSLQASGADSVLDLPSLTTLTGGQPYYGGGVVSVVGEEGGEVELAALTTNGGDPIAIQATTGGNVQINQLTSLNGDSLTVDGTSTIEASSLTTMTSGTITIDGGTPSFPNLSDIDESNISINAGTLTLSEVTSYTGNPQGVDTNLEASGAGSVLDLPNLTTFTGGQSYYGGGLASLVAEQGGQVNLPALTTNGGGLIGVQATMGGTVDINQLTSLNNDSLTVDGTSTIDANSLTTMTSGTITIEGGTPSFPNLSDIDESNIYVNAGNLTLPAVTSYTTLYNDQLTLQASGSGGLLSLPALTSMTTSTSGYARVMVNALSGGDVEMPALTSLSDTVQLTSENSGSVVDIAALTSFQGVSSNFSPSISVASDGSILDADLTSLNDVNLTSDGSGTMAIGQWTTYTSGTATITGGASNFNDLATITNSSFEVSGGGQATLPAVTSYTTLYNDQLTLQASGSGSLLSLPALTSMTTSTSSYARVMINALSGGDVEMPALTSLSDTVQLTSENSGSVVDIAALTSFQGVSSNFSPSISVASDGSILDADLTSLNDVNLTSDGSGTMAISQWTTYTSGTATITGGASNFNDLATITNSSFFVSGDAQVMLPAVANYTSLPNSQPTLQASGSGSLLSLPALTSMTTSTSSYARVMINALSGGDVEMPALTSLSDTVQLTSENSGSVVDIAALTSFQGVSSNFSPSISVASDGSILDADLTSLNDVNLTSDGSGTMAISQWTTYTSGTATITGGASNFNDLATITNSSFFVSGDAQVTLPAVANYTSLPNSQPTLQASGSGSLLSLPALTSMTTSTSSYARVMINALSGGDVEMPALTSLSDTVQLTSENSGSVVDIAALTSFQGVSSNFSPSISVASDGSILDSAPTDLNAVTVTLDGTNNSVVDSWTTFTNGAITIASGSLTLPSLTDMANTTLSPLGGDEFNFPVLSQGNVELSNAESLTIQGALVSIASTNPILNFPQTPGLTFILPTSTTWDGTVFNVGQGSIVEFAGDTLNGVTINGGGEIAGDNSAIVENGLTLNGTLSLGNANSVGALNLNGSQALSGTGTIVFSGDKDEDGFTNYNGLFFTASNQTLTIDSNVTVEGQLGYLGFAYGGNQGIASGDIVNEGTIQASGSGGDITVYALGGIQNAGSLGAIAGSALNLDGSITNASGSVSVDNTSTLAIAGTLSGGTIYTQTGAEISSGTLSGVTVNGNWQVVGNNALTVENGLTLDGTLSLGNASSVGYLNFTGTQTLGGTAAIVFSGDDFPYGYTYYNGLFVATPTTTLTIGPNVTVEGQLGYIGCFGNQGVSSGSIVNQGTIEANVSGGAFTIDATGGIQNDGSLKALDGSTLTLDGSVTNATGSLSIDGTSALLFNSTVTGGTIAAQAGAEITGGTLAGVTIDGSCQIIADDGITVENGLTVNGTLSLGNGTSVGYLVFSGTQTLGGDATVVLGSDSYSYGYTYYNGLFAGPWGATLTLGPNVTVEGELGYIGYFGNQGASNVTIINEGTIESNLAGGSIAIVANGGPFANSGTVNASEGAITISTGNSGSANSGTMAVGPTGTLTISGPYSQSSTGNFNVVLGGSTSGLYGQAVIGGDASLNGALNVSEANGFSPETGNNFTILSYSSLTGGFINYSGLIISSSTALQPTYNTGNFVLGTGTDSTVAPNLLISNLAITPANPLSSQNVTVSWDDINDGNGAAEGSWQDHLVVTNTSTNQTLESEDVPYNVMTNGYLQPNGSFAQSYAFQLPNGLAGAGNLQIAVTTDDYETIEEYYPGEENAYSDNSSTITAISTLNSYPDLQVSGLSVATNDPQSGQNLTIVWHDINTGEGPATGDWVDGATVVNTTTGQTIFTGSLPYNSVTSGSIAAGSSSPQLSYTFALPNGSAGVGNLQITVTTNATGELYEYNSSGTASSDNTASTSATSTLADYADLTVANLSVQSPSTIQSGDQVTIGWEDGNIGDGAVNASFADSILVQRINSDNSLTTVASGAVNGNSSLAGSAESPQTYTFTMPNGASGVGDFVITVTTDSGETVDEYDASGNPAYGNNSNTAHFTATLAPYPDLQATNVSGPASGYTGQSVLVSWTDVNNGMSAATGVWVDNVYAASDSEGDNPVLLGSFAYPGSLGVGDSLQITQEVTLPQISGTEWFMVTTNATQSIPEGLSNNSYTSVASTSIHIAQVALPDLVVTSITPPDNGVLSGTSVPITYVITNQGQAPTSAPVWQDWVILSQDPNLAQTYQGQLNPTGPGGDQTLNNQPVIMGFDNPSYLGVGDSYQQTVDVLLPVNAQGIWFVYVVPDGTGFHHPFAMAEASRTDKLAISAGFTVSLSPTPVLAVSNVQAPAENFSGLPMKVSWTVVNAGTGASAATSWTDAVYISPDSTLDSNAIRLGAFEHEGALAAGGSYTSDESVTLPPGLNGQYYILVETDVNHQVFQNGDTSGNVASTAVAETVNLTPPPELDVNSISLPATVEAGHDFTFSYTVANDGAGGTPNSTWNDAIYLSPTVAYDSTTAIPLGEQTHQGSLAAGASYTNTVTTTFPNGLEGTYYLVVDTDSGNVVYELDNSNNWAISTSSIQASLAPANLVVSDVTAPGSALPGTAIQVAWTVADDSIYETGASTWQDSVYMDTGSTLDASAILLSSFAHDGLLSSSQSYSQSQTVTIPIDLLGNYNLFVVADSAGDVYEGANNNNTSSPIPITISQEVGGRQADLADLDVVSVTSTPVVDGSVTVNWTVQNIGPGTTNANYWNDDVWMSTSPTLSGGGVYLGTFQHTNALAAGDGYSASGTFEIPQSLNPGNYYFIVATNRPIAPPGDADGEGVLLVYESNLSNNEMASTSAISAAPASLADLSVSNVTAPSTAVSGQQLSVGWTVTNTGADTGDVSITDSVYLSYDQVFDPDTDRCLGSATYTGDLAEGANDTQNASISIPAGVAGTFYVFVETNSNGNVPVESTTGNNDDAPQTIQIQLPPPADLVAGAVNAPTNALAGQNITITYQVSNGGSNPANGSWTDALYLSPTPVWSIGDPLVGEVVQNRDLALAQSYEGSLTAPAPAVAPGDYYVILRANVLDNFPESDLGNNESVSLAEVSIDAPTLTLGVAADGTLNQGQSTYYKAIVSAGETLQVAFDSQDQTTYNELYVSFGTMPTRSQYDYRYTQPFAADQEIAIPTTQAGAYYILAYGDDVADAPESYSIEASIVPFSVQSVSPGQVGEGPVTLQITGAQFNFGTTFQLQSSSGSIINPTRVLLQDSAAAYATFDLTGQTLGSYSVWAIQSDETSTELPAGVTVVPATANNSVQISLTVPQAILVGRPGTITIDYDNPGNTDLLAPLILISGQNALFQVPGQTGYTSSALQLIGYNPSGPFGTLTPGFQGSINIPFEPVTAGAGQASTFTLGSLLDPDDPLDWNGFSTNDVPIDASPQEWSAMVTQAETVMGSTWGDVVTFLADNTIQLVENANSQTNPNAVDSLYNFDGLLQYAVGIYGSANPSPSTPNLPVVASWGEVTLYNGNINASGNPVPLNSSDPTYILIPGFGGYQEDFANLAAAIAADDGSFPNGHVNVLIAAWQGASAGPTFDGLAVPWMSSLHINTAGTDLGNLLNSLNQAGKITFSSTTVIGEGSGNDVGNQAAQIAGGLGNAIAFNPASPLSGYLPSNLTAYYQNSIAYETSSLFGLQQSIALSNQMLDTSDLNDPILQQAYGVEWLTEQIVAGNDSGLFLGSTIANAIPLMNNPALLTMPREILIKIIKIIQILALDPNTLIGPKGSGTSAIVPVNSNLPYTIQFSNVSPTQAPAQQIVVNELIDPPNLDWASFRLSSFGFNGQTFSIPGNSSYYQTTLDFNGYDVEFTATIDESTGLATWTFTTIDPSTGQVPLDPTVGLLPVVPSDDSSDDSNGIGEGFVSYTIEANPADPTGSIISAQASVTFDTQPPLETPEVFNTVDAGTDLTSSVAALPAVENSNPFNVDWSGSDSGNGSGVSDYTVYVSDDGGPYTVWLADTALTSAPFTGQNGHAYSFYSVATDNAGDVQPTAAAAQAKTVVDSTLPTSTVSILPEFSPGSFTVNWSGGNSSGIGIASYDIYVSVNGGAFSPWLINSAGTSATFTGQNGDTYAFSSVATDDLGVQGSMPPSAQASTEVDAIAPTSAVNSLPALSPTSFTLIWSGSDDPGGSGLAVYSIYVSDDGAAFIPLLTETTSTSMTFTGVADHTYAFFSIATDHVGNVQPIPSSPQATTTIATPSITSISPSVGESTENTDVTIEGTYLADASAVLFGSSFGTIESDTNTQIVVQSPTASPGTVDVTVITALGSSAATNAAEFTYLPPVDPATCVLSSASSTFQAGNSITVALQAKDAESNDLPIGGLNVEFEASGGETFGPTSYAGNGKYTASFFSTATGNYTISASINGQAVTSGSLSINVTPGNLDAGNSLVYLPANLPAPAIQLGGSTTVTLQARDAFGNDLTTSGLKVAFALENKTGAKGTLGKVTDNKNGTYSATFKGTLDGSNFITATVNGVSVASTAPITVSGGAYSLFESTVTVSSATIVAGTTATVTLQVEYSKNIAETAGGLTVSFKLGSTSGGQGTFNSVSDLGDGKYAAIFTGTLAGSNTIKTVIDGQALTSRPPAIAVEKGPISFSKSVVTASSASLLAGGTATLTFQPEDAGGNKLTLGTAVEPVFVLENGSGSFGSVAYNSKTGAYTTTFTPTTAGSDTIETNYDNQVVTSKAPTITVNPGPVSLTTSVLSVSQASVPVGSKLTVTLLAVDESSNRETAGLAIAFMLGSGSGKGTFSKMTYAGDGVYQATFTATKVGTAIIEAMIGSKKFKSTASISVTAA